MTTAPRADGRVANGARGDLRRLTVVDLLVIGLALCGAAAVLLGLGGPARFAIGAAAYALLPGWSIVRWFRTRLTTLTGVAIAIGTSVALSAVSGSLMLLFAAWNPTAYIMAASFVSIGLTVVPVEARPRSAPQRGSTTRALRRRWASPNRNVTLALVAAGAVALVCWLLSLRPVSTTELGPYGLLPIYAPTWYIALALVVASWIVAYLRGLPAFLAVMLALFTTLFYATTALIEAAPHLPYVYKHVAVTRLFEATGTLHPDVDIYNRWPGFFASSALFDTWTGAANPVEYVAFGELVFALLNAVLIYLIARTLRLTARSALVAASIFTAGNWVGQGYYSPQAFAFALYLLLALVVLTFLRRKPIALVLRLEDRVARSVGRRKHHPLAREVEQLPVPEPTVSRKALIVRVALVVLLQAAIVISHQLTPYMAVVGFLPIALFGFVRPRFLGFILVAMNLLFLWPNFDYVQQHFGVLSGFDFFDNATTSLRSFGVATTANVIQSHVVTGLTIAIILLAVLGFIARARTGDIRSVLIVGWLSFAPLVILLGQSYGGEGRLRVVLFGLPWWSIGVVWLASELTLRRPLGPILFSAATVLIVSAFTFAALQPEADNAVAKQDIQAAEWIDTHVQPQDQVVGAVPQHPLFPLTIDSRYPVVLQNQENAYAITAAVESTTLAKKMAGLKAGVADLQQGATIYVVFSLGQIHSAILHRVAGYKNLPEFEARVAALPGAHLVYDNGQDRVYALTNES